MLGRVGVKDACVVTKLEVEMTINSSHLMCLKIFKWSNLDMCLIQDMGPIIAGSGYWLVTPQSTFFIKWYNLLYSFFPIWLLVVEDMVGTIILYHIWMNFWRWVGPPWTHFLSYCIGNELNISLTFNDIFTQNEGNN